MQQALGAAAILDRILDQRRARNNRNAEVKKLQTRRTRIINAMGKRLAARINQLRAERDAKAAEYDRKIKVLRDKARGGGVRTPEQERSIGILVRQRAVSQRSFAQREQRVITQHNRLRARALKPIERRIKQLLKQ